MLATKIDQGSVLMPLGNARIDGSRPICWESRAFAERVPSTFADRAERAYHRTRDPHNDLRRLVPQEDIRPIGILDTITGTIELEWERDAADLARWLGTATLDPSELSTTRGVIVGMYRDLVREHGELLPQSDHSTRAKHPVSRRSAWHAS